MTRLHAVCWADFAHHLALGIVHFLTLTCLSQTMLPARSCIYKVPYNENQAIGSLKYFWNIKGGVVALVITGHMPPLAARCTKVRRGSYTSINTRGGNRSFAAGAHALVQFVVSSHLDRSLIRECCACFDASGELIVADAAKGTKVSPGQRFSSARVSHATRKP